MKTILVVCQHKTVDSKGQDQSGREYEGGAHGPTNMLAAKAKVIPGKSNSYDHTHINRMKAQLDEVGAEYDRMIAITNVDPRLIDTDVEVIQLPTGDEYLGWWSKMYMYNPNMRLEGTVLYIDLDMMPGEQFNTLWTEKPEYDVLCRRACHLDGLKHTLFTPGVNRSGEKWDYLSWIYNTSLIRFRPEKLAALWVWYQYNVQRGWDLGVKGDELFVAKWLIDNSDTVSHTEFDPKYMPSYPSLILRHLSGNATYDPDNLAYTLSPGRRMDMTPSTGIASSEGVIPWHRLSALTMGGAWKPWNVAVKDSHIAERYYGEL